MRSRRYLQRTHAQQRPAQDRTASRPARGPEESYGAALVYFTGSKAHNIAIRRIAQNKGLKLNEYGVFQDDKRIAGETEESVYNALGLPWIPPELREDNGEIQAALAGEVPKAAPSARDKK